MQGSMNVAELWSNHSSDTRGQCIHPTDESCSLTQAQVGIRDTIAGLRLVISLLSIIGAVSIIVSAIYKRQVSSPKGYWDLISQLPMAKVHPIFVLSIADCLLAVLWVVGGTLWFRGVSHDRVWCFVVTLLTVILECVTINLTFVYALFAYVHIKQTNLNSLMTTYFEQLGPMWHPLKVAAVYLLAWVLPVVLVVVPFGALAKADGVVRDANNCSCWCIPEFANLLPISSENGTAEIKYGQKLMRVVLSFAVIVSTHYLVVFILLAAFYYKILQRIKRMRSQDEYPGSTFYGATEALIVRGHSQAKQRAVLFLTVFIVTGFCNLILAIIIVVYFSEFLSAGPPPPLPSGKGNGARLGTPIAVIMMIQSITVPLQGFLNAIVYGWTREDFLYIMASTKNRQKAIVDPDVDCTSDFEDSVRLIDEELRVQRQDTPDVSL